MPPFALCHEAIPFPKHAESCLRLYRALNLFYYHTQRSLNHLPLLLTLWYVLRHAHVCQRAASTPATTPHPHSREQHSYSFHSRQINILIWGGVWPSFLGNNHIMNASVFHPCWYCSYIIQRDRSTLGYQFCPLRLPESVSNKVPDQII